jgi:hypothetical protein
MRVAQFPQADLAGLPGWQPLEDGRYRPIVRLHEITVSAATAAKKLRCAPEQVRRHVKPFAKPQPGAEVFSAADVRAAAEKRMSK